MTRKAQTEAPAEVEEAPAAVEAPEAPVEETPDVESSHEEAPVAEAPAADEVPPDAVSTVHVQFPGQYLTSIGVGNRFVAVVNGQADVWPDEVASCIALGGVQV